MTRIHHLIAGAASLLVVIAPAAAEEMTAANIIDAATEAAGGDVWKRPKTLMLEGSMMMYQNGEWDKAVVVDDYKMWRKFPAAVDQAHAANGKVRFQAKADGKTVFEISFDGKYTYDQTGRLKEDSANRRWAANFGFGIIRFADTEGFQLKRLADDTIDGHDCYLVEITDNEEGKTIFAIDKDGYEVRMVGFDTPRGWHHRLYSDFAWAEDPGFRQPRHVRLYYNGRMTNDIKWPRFKINQPISDDVFVLE